LVCFSPTIAFKKFRNPEPEEKQQQKITFFSKFHFTMDYDSARLLDYTEIKTFQQPPFSPMSQALSYFRKKVAYQ
jgi:hypothetical protein